MGMCEMVLGRGEYEADAAKGNERNLQDDIGTIQ